MTNNKKDKVFEKAKPVFEAASKLLFKSSAFSQTMNFLDKTPGTDVPGGTDKVVGLITKSSIFCLYMCLKLFNAR